MSISSFRLVSEGVLGDKSFYIVFLITVFVFIANSYIRSPWRQVPPGPTGLPFIGSALKLGGQQWLTFTEWKKTYGDVVYFTAFGQPMLVLNSYKAAFELLDRRAGIYSDRQNSIVGGQILTGGLFISLARYGDMWRRMRKASHESLHKGRVASYQQLQATEALFLARYTLAKPIHWEKHIRRAIASVSMSIVYDSPSIESEENKSVTFINNMAFRLLGSMLPGAYLVEFFPFLMAIPSRFAKWKRGAEEWYAHDSAVFERLYEEVCSRVVSGDERPSFSATLIKDAGRFKLSLREKAWLAAAMFAGGASTTAGALSWWMLAMVLYPDVQKCGQAELDRVVGRDRLPSFADFEHLPYIQAMVEETLRWRPILPMGLLHRLTQDDWYEGHFIPKDTAVIANIWHLNHNPATFGEDAGEFNPARHLGRERDSLAADKGVNHVSYGFGRRVCVGQHIANNSLFINIAMLLWAMNIERSLDAYGKPAPLDVDGCVDSGLVVSPVPFECKITPRFPEAMTILEQEHELLGNT